MRRSILQIILTLVCCVFAAQTLTWLYSDAMANFGYDYYEFWVGGDIVRHYDRTSNKPLDLYSAQAFHSFGSQYLNAARHGSARQREAAMRWSVLETIASPFFFWTFSLFTSGHYDRDYTIFVIVSIASLILSIVLLGRRLKLPPAAIALAVALAAMSSPVYSDLHVANVNCPELLVCTAYLLLRTYRGSTLDPRDAKKTTAQLFAGVVIGLLLALKPNLLLAAVLLMWSDVAKCRWRAFLFQSVGVCVAITLAIGISSWKFAGVSCWLGWMQAIRVLTRIGEKSIMWGNASLSETIYENTGRNISVLLAMALVSLALLTIWQNARKPKTENAVLENAVENDCRLFGLAAAITFLASPLAWIHYCVLVIPFLLMLAGIALRPRAAVERIFAGIVLLVLLGCMLLPLPPQIMAILPIHLHETTRIPIPALQMAMGLIVVAGLILTAGVFGKIPNAKHESARIDTNLHE